MDSLEESKSFFKHVFNFDDDSKSEILNILQYSIIAIIPIVILNKAMQKYIPEADDKKSTLEVTSEVVIQIVVMFMGLLIINRIITYIPTYSGAKYPDVQIVYIILAILMITMSLQTKLGEKVSILVDRVFELWNGKQPDKRKSGNNGTVKISQPISGQPNMVTGQAYTDGTAISSLPPYDAALGQVSSQQLPNYNAMYKQENTPLVDAATPGMSENMMTMEPAAANSVLGGSSFGSW